MMGRDKKMYIPNLKRASRNMTKHMFRGKNGESEFPHHSRYVPHAEDNVFTYRNPSTILGALSKELIQLRHNAEEQVIKKRLTDTIFW